MPRVVYSTLCAASYYACAMSYCFCAASYCFCAASYKVCAASRVFYPLLNKLLFILLLNLDKILIQMFLIFSQISVPFFVPFHVRMFLPLREILPKIEHCTKSFSFLWSDNAGLKKGRKTKNTNK